MKEKIRCRPAHSSRCRPDGTTVRARGHRLWHPPRKITNTLCLPSPTLASSPPTVRCGSHRRLGRHWRQWNFDQTEAGPPRRSRAERPGQVFTALSPCVLKRPNIPRYNERCNPRHRALCRIGTVRSARFRRSAGGTVGPAAHRNFMLCQQVVKRTGSPRDHPLVLDWVCLARERPHARRTPAVKARHATHCIKFQLSPWLLAAPGLQTLRADLKKLGRSVRDRFGLAFFHVLTVPIEADSTITHVAASELDGIFERPPPAQIDQHCRHSLNSRLHPAGIRSFGWQLYIVPSERGGICRVRSRHRQRGRRRNGLRHPAKR
mmetsp:Transcript_27995/g.83635  ORF Transcript_27995/g.83635 Transcript_27995/m.83635 type:complete len:320 (+) Transcript_27995:1641-2600(+)